MVSVRLTVVHGATFQEYFNRVAKISAVVLVCPIVDMEITVVLPQQIWSFKIQIK